MIVTKAYLVYVAPSGTGKLGCALMLARVGPTWGEDVAAFAMDQIVVVRSEPRILWLSTRLEGRAFDIVNVHAPHSGASKGDIKAVWATIREYAAQVNGELILMGDVNAHVGTEVSSSVGGHCPERQNFNGECRHATIQSLGLVPPIDCLRLLRAR